MPSSTSNSNSRIPHAPYGKQWLLALLLFAGLLLPVELALREQGHLPSVTDSMALWAYQRSQVYPHPRAADETKQGAKHIVLLGSSRMQLGVAPDVLEQTLPGYTVTQLGINGTVGLAVLKDLAEDPAFTGLVIYDANIVSLARQGETSQQRWVDYYRREWSHWGRWDKVANLTIQTFLQERFLLFSSTLSPRQLLVFIPGAAPAYIETRPDRYRAAHYYRLLTPAGLDRLRTRIIDLTQRNYARTAPTSQADFLDSLHTLVRPAVAKIQQRGGNVLFLHFPVGAELRDLYDTPELRRQYWDQIAPITGAPTLHFADIPAMRALPVPDASHLDAKDARRFTLLLADELRRLQLVSVAE